MAGICECGNEPWGSIKCGEYLDKFSPGVQLVKELKDVMCSTCSFQVKLCEEM